MDRIPAGTLVTLNGKIGVTVDGTLGVCSSWETPVVWEGQNYFSGTPTEELKIIGPEKAIADFVKCGAGKGPKCCIFLSVGQSGPTCERFGSLRTSLIFNDKMAAKRNPTEMFPKCQLS
jgi:hypothetical protein